MTNQQNYPETDPRYHTARLKQMLRNTAEHAREDIEKVDDPRARALFETTAEVLIGLETAYRHFEEKSEPAWR
ncbi:MAG TPA: hypothetical protein VFL95_07615 [Gemmatimonadales bacterium]|nr:hypothetical protein [Gemmatimonadales bacterium]